MESRSINSAKNLLVGILGQFLNVVLSFVTRTVFIRLLSQEYLGLSGLFTNVLTILSLSELGVGSAIMFALYKPLAEKDEEKVTILMGLYAKAYRIIGLTILTIGLILLPIAPLFAKGSTGLVNIRILFLLYLLDSVSTYVFFAYKSALLKADQKNYVVYSAEYVVAILRSAIRIVALYFLKGTPSVAFYLYCIIGIFFNLVSNLITAIITDKKYPYIRTKTTQSLSNEEMSVIKKNIVGAFANKISAAANESLGTLIISSFIGVVIMGVYSNYLYIINIINTFVRIFASSISASIGNYNAVESTENKIGFLKKLHFIYSWIYGFSAICLWVMLNPFIEIWAGEEFLLSKEIVLLAVYNFFAYGLLSSIATIQQESGVYWESRFISILSAAVCILSSLYFTLILHFGIAGVLLATIISRVAVELPYRSFITCKYVFKEKAGLYIKMYIKTTLFVLVNALIYTALFYKMPVSWFWVIIRLIICVLFINASWCFLFRNREEFKYLIKIVAFLFKRLMLSLKNGNNRSRVNSNT